MRRWLVLIAACVALGCGSSPEKPPESPVKKQRTSARAAKKPARMQKAKKPRELIPQRCSKRRSLCLPPAAWVKRLCDDVYPDVALHMFRPGTPWLRLYMRANAPPVNASGGMSLIGDPMRRGEEVIALRRRNMKSGFQVSDISGYDVLRWNGACATIHDGDFTRTSPDEVLHARLEYRDLGLPLRQTLEAQPDFSETYKARRKHCRGHNIGQVSIECEEFDRKLVDEVVRYVRSGAKLPKPTKAPAWRGTR
jgi:hypothetical protein